MFGLFQNSARVHFDAHLTDGKPLVFGGYPMSVGYAQAFNGFENRLGIVAINGGTHSAPTFAGDTLYARSEILEVERAPRGDVGFVRARLVGIKNADPESTPLRVEKDGKTRHHPDVVLDLDHWVLLPCRER